MDYVGTKWLVVDPKGWNTDKGCIWTVTGLTPSKVGCYVSHTRDKKFISDTLASYLPGDVEWRKRMIPYNDKLVKFDMELQEVCDCL